MKRAKVLKTYSLRLKRDGKARVFKLKNINTYYGLRETFDVYQVWWRGDLIYNLTEVASDAKLRALGIADGINQYHLTGGQTWPIEEVL